MHNDICDFPTPPSVERHQLPLDSRNTFEKIVADKVQQNFSSVEIRFAQQFRNEGYTPETGTIYGEIDIELPRLIIEVKNNPNNANIQKALTHLTRAEVNANSKHIIIFTDGRASPEQKVTAQNYNATLIDKRNWDTLLSAIQQYNR